MAKNNRINLDGEDFCITNASYKTSSNLSLSEKTPMIGLYGVWNENTEQNGSSS